jgi:hypothetical protein
LNNARGLRVADVAGGGVGGDALDNAEKSPEWLDSGDGGGGDALGVGNSTGGRPYCSLISPYASTVNGPKSGTSHVLTASMPWSLKRPPTNACQDARDVTNDSSENTNEKAYLENVR